MSKVLLASDSPYLNTGFSRVARFIGESLQAAGHEIFHIGFSDPRPDPKANKWGGRIVPWPVFQTYKVMEDRFGMLSYGQALLQAQPDLVIIVADVWNVDHLLINSPVPTVLFLHIEGEPLPMKFFYEKGREVIIPQIISHANFVVSAGPFSRTTMQKRLIEYAQLPPGKSPEEIKNIISNSSIIICDPVDTEVFKPIDRTGLKSKMFKGIKNTDFVIGYFGRQNPRKGLPYLLEAFAKWEQRPDDVYLYLHTAIKDRAGWNLPQLLTDLGITEKVIIDPSIRVGGGCSEEVLNALYNSCFPAGTPVRAEHGWTRIETVKKGDIVYSAEGKKRKVLATSKRDYRGPMVGLFTTRNQAGIVCTPNHKFKVLDSKNEVVFTAAENLKEGDIVLSPYLGSVGMSTSSTARSLCDALNSQEGHASSKKQDSVIEDVSGDPAFLIRPRTSVLPAVKISGVTYIAAVVEKKLTIELAKGDKVPVYNFEVEEDHTYIAGGVGVKNCDITALPSSGEGAGLTALESSAAGVPVITTDYAEAPSYVSDVCELVEPAAFWVEPITNIRRAIPNVERLAKKMKKFYRERPYIKTLGDRARAKMISSFDTRKIAVKWVDLVDQVSKTRLTPHVIETVPVNRQKKRVLFVGSYFLPDLIGGGEITYHKMLKEFQAKGWATYAYVCRDGIRDEATVIDNIHITQSDKNSVERKLSRYMNLLHPDVVITTLIDPNFTRAAIKIAKAEGAVTIYYEQFYNSICTKYRDVMRLGKEDLAPWGQEILGSSDLIYANGPFVQAAMAKHQGFSSKILHPYIDFKDCKVETNTKEYVTMINPDPGKGGETFMYMVKNMPDVKFLTVKVSSGCDYRALPPPGSQPNLTIWDFQTDIKKIYEVSKAILVPTVVDETFCRVIPEAQSNGIPVIGRNVGGIRDTMGDGGILIDKYDDDDVWCSTLQNLLNDKEKYDFLSVKAVENHKRFDYRAEFDSFFADIEKSLAGNEREKKKICCVFPNFPGVAEVFTSMQKIMPDDINLVRIPQPCSPMRVLQEIMTSSPKTVVFGAWIPLYREIMKRIKEKNKDTKIVVSWFSNFSQMEFSVNNELDLFNEVKKMMKEESLIDEIWMSSEEDGIALGKHDPRVKVLPCPVPIRDMKVLPRDPMKIRVSLFCTPGPRKNLSAQILACSMVPNLELHLNGLSQRPEFKDLLQNMKVNYIDHGWMDKETYLDTLSSMDVCLQVTFAETFNYVVAEAMMQGTPVVTSFMVPIIARDPDLHELCVQKADSPNEIAAKIIQAAGLRDYYSKAVRQSILSLAERNNHLTKVLLGLEPPK